MQTAFKRMFPLPDVQICHWRETLNDHLVFLSVLG